MKKDEIVHNTLKLQSGFYAALNLLYLFGGKVRCGNLEVRTLLYRIQNINTVQHEEKELKNRRGKK